MGVISHASLERTWRSLVRFISAFWALPGALVQLSPSRSDPLRQDISMAL